MKYTYKVMPRIPIRGIGKSIIRKPTVLNLEKEEVGFCLNHGPVYRKFDENTLVRVYRENIERLHQKEYVTEEEVEEQKRTNFTEEPSVGRGYTGQSFTAIADLGPVEKQEEEKNEIEKALVEEGLTSEEAETVANVVIEEEQEKVIQDEVKPEEKVETVEEPAPEEKKEFEEPSIEEVEAPVEEDSEEETDTEETEEVAEEDTQEDTNPQNNNRRNNKKRRK